MPGVRVRVTEILDRADVVSHWRDQHAGIHPDR